MFSIPSFLWSGSGVKFGLRPDFPRDFVSRGFAGSGTFQGLRRAGFRLTGKGSFVRPSERRGPREGGRSSRCFPGGPPVVLGLSLSGPWGKRAPALSRSARRSLTGESRRVRDDRGLHKDSFGLSRGRRGRPEKSGFSFRVASISGRKGQRERPSLPIPPRSRAGKARRGQNPGNRRGRVMKRRCYCKKHA